MKKYIMKAILLFVIALFSCNKTEKLTEVETENKPTYFVKQQLDIIEIAWVCFMYDKPPPKMLYTTVCWGRDGKVEKIMKSWEDPLDSITFELKCKRERQANRWIRKTLKTEKDRKDKLDSLQKIIDTPLPTTIILGRPESGKYLKFIPSNKEK